jgi:hypothetical protein
VRTRLSRIVFSSLWGQEEGLSRFLGLLLLFLFVVVPLGASTRPARPVAVAIDATLCLTAVSGALTVGRGRRHTVVVTAAAVVAFALRLFEPAAGSGGHAISAVLFGIIFLSLAGLLLGRVLQEGPVTRHRIEGAVAAYLVFALVSASCHDAIGAVDPGAVRSSDGSPVTGADLLYLSLVTLTTIGYGDLVPANPWSRSVSTLTGLIGQLYPAILIARLVSLELAERNSKGGCA